MSHRTIGALIHSAIFSFKPTRNARMSNKTAEVKNATENKGLEISPFEEVGKYRPNRRRQANNALFENCCVGPNVTSAATMLMRVLWLHQEGGRPGRPPMRHGHHIA